MTKAKTKAKPQAKKAAAPATPSRPEDPGLSRIAPKEVIALMLWRLRHRDPSLSMAIEDRDRTALEKCCKYLGVEPEVGIMRRKDKVFVALVAAGTATYDGDGKQLSLGNGIKPIEDNEEDNELAKAAAKVNSIRSSARGLAQDLLGMMRSGTYSTDTITAAAQALEVLARV